jgi:hypothetical protein
MRVVCLNLCCVLQVCGTVKLISLYMQAPLYHCLTVCVGPVSCPECTEVLSHLSFLFCGREISVVSFFFLNFFLFVCVCVSECMHAHLCMCMNMHFSPFQSKKLDLKINKYF